MFDVLVGMSLIGIIGSCAYKYQKNKENLKESSRKSLQVTEHEYLGMLNSEGINFVYGVKPVGRKMAQELENAFPIAYEVNVFNRMVKEGHGTPEQVLYLIQEQKRFLVMTKFLKNVPMFSNQVDEVWHQMLMFTREYESFCKDFSGEFIHHQPNVDGVDHPDSRFHFDMMYHLLFSETYYSRKAWGSLFAKSPSLEYMQNWADLTEAELHEKYFRLRDGTSKELAKEIIHLVKTSLLDSITESKESEFIEKRKNIRKLRAKSGFSKGAIAVHLTLPYVFWACAGDAYLSDIGLNKVSASTQSSGCSTVSSCGGGSGSGSGGHGDGGGSSHSCGSSCGGGCGS